MEKKIIELITVSRKVTGGVLREVDIEIRLTRGE